MIEVGKRYLSRNGYKAIVCMELSNGELAVFHESFPYSVIMHNQEGKCLWANPIRVQSSDYDLVKPIIDDLEIPKLICINPEDIKNAADIHSSNYSVEYWMATRKAFEAGCEWAISEINK